jgi:hypothetical protein
MALHLDETTRLTMSERILALQEQLMRNSLSARSLHNPHKWAYGFAGKPREFLGRLAVVHQHGVLRTVSIHPRRIHLS